MHSNLGHVGDAGHHVVAKIALLHQAVFEGDGSTGQAGAQAHQRRALYLRLNRLGVDRQVAMHGSRHRMQLGHPLGDRCLGHIGYYRIKRLMHGHTPGLALGQLAFAVTRLLHRQHQRGLVAGVLVTHQFHAVGHRVLVGSPGDFIDQGFHDIRCVCGAHAAPPQHRHVDLGVVHRQAHGHFIRLAHAFHNGGVYTVLDHHGCKGRAFHNRLAHDDMVPGQHLALGVKTDLGTVHVHGAVVAAFDVILAAPQHTNRCIHTGCHGHLGHGTGLNHIVGRGHGTAAKTATGHLHIHLDVLGWHAQHLGRCHAVKAGHLCAQVDGGLGVCTTAGDMHGAVQRLHGRMGQVREGELGTDLLGRLGERRHIGLVLQRARLLGQGLVAGQLGGAVDLLHARGVPLQLQRITRLLGGPVALGNHGHALPAPVGGHAQHGFDTRYGLGGRVVQRLDLGAKDCRVGHHGSQHARQLHINTEVLFAAGFGKSIQPGCGFANDAETLGVLQGHLVGHGHLHGGIGQIAVADGLASRAKDHAVFGAQCAGIHTPLRSRSAHQHGAGTGAQLAVLHEGALDGARASGQVHAKGRVHIGGVGIAVFGGDLAPVSVQLFGQAHGQGGPHTLAKLQAVDGDGDRAILCNPHEGRGLLEWFQAGWRGGLCASHQGKGTQGKARGRAQFQEAAPGQPFSCY